MPSLDEIRRSVSATYTRAVSAPAITGCGCVAPSADAGWARSVGYGDEDIESAPDAASQSLGCGNPLASCQLRPGDVVLDLGSGAGFDLALAAARVAPGGRAIGVDMTDAMNEAARGHAASGGLDHVEVRHGFIEELPVGDASVDRVISNCAINLSPDKPAVFREIARVLRPGGRVAICDIVADALPEGLRASQALYDACIAGAAPEAEYVDGLRDAGLAEVEVARRTPLDPTRLTPLVDAATPGLEAMGGCCGTSPTREALEAMAPVLAGALAAVEIRARKP